MNFRIQLLDATCHTVIASQEVFATNLDNAKQRAADFYGDDKCTDAVPQATPKRRTI